MVSMFGQIENLVSFKPVTNLNVQLSGSRTLPLVAGTDYTFTTLMGTPTWLTTQEKNVLEYYVEKNLNFFTLTMQVVPVYGQPFVNTPTTGEQTVTINWDVSNVQQVNLTSQTTTVLLFENTQTAYQPLYLYLLQDATGTNLVTWGTSLKQAGGSETLTLSTTQTYLDVISILFDGTSYIQLDIDKYVK